jgi:2-polyprenyl-6-methoxyphenol hydroxylase-like FAD-dependent oxidoreductase
MPPSPPPVSLRIVIVGGGPVGLIAAHALVAARIDFILLSEHDAITTSYGPHLCAYPDTLRVFDQLGLLAKLERIRSTMRHTKVYSKDAEDYVKEPFQASCQDK